MLGLEKSWSPPSILVALAVAGCLAVVVAMPAAAAETTRVSVASDGAEADDWSNVPSISADGRYVAFYSPAGNLVSDDTNDMWDVFVRDRRTGETERVSVANDGTEGLFGSGQPSISADGRYVAFTSDAWNLVAGSTTPWADVLVKDRQTGDVERVSVASDGTEGDGGHSGDPSISADGRYVAFLSFATNLVPADTNDKIDVFVHDRQTGETQRVSVASDGTEGNGNSDYASISPDGRYVAFNSFATNLITTDTNPWADVFVHDRQTGETQRVSVASDGTEGNQNSYWPSISADGHYVAFLSEASNLVPDDTNPWADVFVHDRQTGETERVSVSSDGTQADGDYPPSITPDGRYVAFCAGTEDLAPGETNGVLEYDVFVRDRQLGETYRVSIAHDGTESNYHSKYPSISADGCCVAFQSDATNLVPGDTNDQADVFVYDMSVVFADVPSDYWAFDYINACVETGIVRGYPDGFYRPEQTVTRDQIAVYISRALCLPGDIPAGPVESPFSDVPVDHWAYDSIAYVAANNVVQGYGNGTYHPEYDVTRGQMAVFVARSIVDPLGEEGLAAYEPPEEARFRDVPTDFWCYKHVEYLAALGVVNGYPDRTYGPELRVTRGQMAVYIARAFELPM